ncbi:MAG: hypothetical protein GTO18_06530 [Anaerolineales bacterium]|nr:hypothetical protein [Anaerolineales bacterium]
MNSQITLEISPEVQSKDKVHRLVAPLKSSAISLAKSITEKSIQSSKTPTGTKRNYRLGEAVRHGKFGAGQVLGHWPDGRLLIRFDSEVMSRLVFTSLLN